MNDDLIALLGCPVCRQELAHKEMSLQCVKCAAGFPIVQGVPIFRSDPEPVAIMPLDHHSNPLGAEFEEILRQGNERVLHLGAGATASKYPGCVELEHKIFRHTDVVGDAHALPFRDGVFDRVLAFNVFEHLRDPRAAAREILRVLKPGGALALHTAFLQALHEAPHHYYNATEFGVREWFSDFTIERCGVSGNFSPGVMLGYLSASLLETLRQSELPGETQSRIAETRLGQWADFWNRGGNPPPGFHEMLALPQDFQKRVSAGFELLARKPDVAA